MTDVSVMPSVRNVDLTGRYPCYQTLTRDTSSLHNPKLSHSNASTRQVPKTTSDLTAISFLEVLEKGKGAKLNAELQSR